MHKIFVATVMNLIYILLILTPLIGFIIIYQTGALSYDLGGPFPEDAVFDKNLVLLHKISIFSLLTLIVIHVTGVLLYSLINRENLLKRMT